MEPTKSELIYKNACLSEGIEKLQIENEELRVQNEALGLKIKRIKEDMGTLDYYYKEKLAEKDQQISDLEGHIKGLTKVRNYEKCKHIRKRKRLQQQIADLEEQLKNAIVPKFKIGQEIYYYHIARNKTYSGYVEDIQWFATRNGIYYRISQLQRDYFWIREDEIFATKEEAQAKLKELQGE